MNTHPEYDRLAAIYDQWSYADPAAKETLTFYVAECLAEVGQVVELGVGTGRIALEVASQGKPLTGVDCSSAMLERCRIEATRMNLTEYVRLLLDDIRNFTLDQPASLIIFPFRTFGHLLTDEDKLSALQNIRRNLAPGGRLIFDHYIFDTQWARTHNGVPRLMCTIERTNYELDLVWDTYLYDFGQQRMQCFISVETVDSTHTVVSRSHYPLSFSWVSPDQVRRLLQQAGLVIEALYGDFKRGPFTESSLQQVWVVQRPIDI